MLFQAWLLSILPWQDSSYHPAHVWLLSLRLQPAFIAQRSVSPDYPGSFSSSLRCLRSVFLVGTPPRTSFWIASYEMPQMVGPFLLPSLCCSDSLDDIVGWNAWSIWRICLPVTATGSFSEHCPLYFVLTSQMDEMLDLATYGLHGGKPWSFMSRLVLQMDLNEAKSGLWPTQHWEWQGQPYIMT